MNNNDYKEALFYAASIFNERLGTEFSEDNLVLCCFQTENQQESFEQFCKQYFPDRLTDRYKEEGYFDFHASVFIGEGKNSVDGILLRTQLTPIYDANKIDVVLQGHDHTYARTYQLSSDGKQHASFDDLKKGQQGQSHKLLNNALKNKEFKNNYESQNLCYTIADMKQGVLHNPKGVFYMSSNSATGSKYYNLIPQQQDYIAARSQSWRPTYSVVHITDSEFTINTYDVETGTAIDDSYSIVKD